MLTISSPPPLAYTSSFPSRPRFYISLFSLSLGLRRVDWRNWDCLGDVGRPLAVWQCGGIGLLLAVWSGSADGVAVLAWTAGSSAEVTSALAGGADQVCPLSRSTRAPSTQEWMRDLFEV